ncbi:MAG: nucleotidyl transferase AbiEii/AbiGii toxin family protein, partial [Candidatus Limnocylindrales bacterium]
DAAIGQMLPPGVVKGGAAMQIRLGDAESRATRDLDAARAAELSLEAYLQQLDESLASGWAGFTGTVHEAEGSNPDDVPPDYVMRPFVIRLSYRGSFWFNLPFELGRDEVGSTVAPELRMSASTAGLFAGLGLPAPEPIPLLPVDHQMAQKFHACTWLDRNGQNDRAHDLVDLQILVRVEAPDLAGVGTTARRLFESRRAQSWPPTVSAHDRWDTLYAAAAEGLDVIETVAEAIDWANWLIAQVDSANGAR